MPTPPEGHPRLTWVRGLTGTYAAALPGGVLLTVKRGDAVSRWVACVDGEPVGSAHTLAAAKRLAEGAATTNTGGGS